MTTEPTLRLDTLVADRTTISIVSTLHPDGRLYELRKGDELSMETLTELQVLGQKAEAVGERVDNLTQEDAKLLDDWTRRMMELIFHTELEPEVYEALNQGQRLQVMQAFTDHSLTVPQSREARRAATKRKTGAK
jgi:hypothetical protein